MLLPRFPQLVEAGQLKPIIDRNYPFAQIADAHK
ncbi:MAG: zinc-binding dehydrogenase [Anaerolineales bacterium]|nr:zinc-binding dehydrogenase [Anaerolineales bacterium]